jgi:hypothetical protein
MKKNNNEGFVLAEAVVVGVFILSLFTFLFINIVPLVGKYDSIKKYDTVDAVYNTNIVKMLLLSFDTDDVVLGKVDSDHPYLVFHTNSSFCDYMLECTGNACYRLDWCETMLGPRYLDVKSIIITRYRLGTESGNDSHFIKYQIKSNGDFTRAQQEYIASLDNYTQPAGSYYDRYHRIIVEYNDGSFANLEIKR